MLYMLEVVQQKRGLGQCVRAHSSATECLAKEVATLDFLDSMNRVNGKGEGGKEVWYLHLAGAG